MNASNSLMKRRLKNQFLNYITNPYNIIVIVSVILLAYLIVFPLFQIVATTFRVLQKDMRRIPGSHAGDFTLYYWHRLLFSDLSQSLLYKPLLNSMVIGLIVSFISIVLGAVVAWLLVRTDLPLKRFFSLMVIIPYILPSWSMSMAWSAVFKNSRVGGVPGFLSNLGINTPNWLAYGPFPIIVVLSLHYYAYAYLLTAAALKSINSELEEMGEVVGASKATIIRKITFPLVLPSLLSAFILSFSKSIGTFSVPAYLGMKVNYYTISTMLYAQNSSANKATAYAIALILIVISSVNIFINQKAIGSRKSYATIGGKGGRSTLIKLGWVKWLILAIFLIFVLVGIIAPLVILCFETLMLKPGILSLDNLSLHYWTAKAGEVPTLYEGEAGILANESFWSSVWNTFKLVILTSLFASAIGQLMGYVISRGRRKLSGKLIEQLVFIPYLIPSIAFGAIYISMFATKHLFLPTLYGTFALLVLISVVKNLPFASRSGTSSMMQISSELEEAAIIEGSGFIHRFAKVILPLSKGGFFSGFMLIYIGVMKELDLLILLLTPRMCTLSYLAFTYTNNNYEPYAYAIAVVIFFLTFGSYWLGGKISKVDLVGGLS